VSTHRSKSLCVVWKKGRLGYDDMRYDSGVGYGFYTTRIVGVGRLCLLVTNIEIHPSSCVCLWPLIFIQYLIRMYSMYVHMYIASLSYHCGSFPPVYQDGEAKSIVPILNHRRKNKHYGRTLAPLPATSRPVGYAKAASASSTRDYWWPRRHSNLPICLR